MRVNNYSLTFKINLRKTPDRYLKPIALFVDPKLQTGAPYLGSGEVAYTPFRKRAVVPSSCLMYKVNDDGEIDIVNIKGLPYDFVRLVLHGDYDYKEGDNLKHIIDMRLYNDRIRAFTQGNIQRVETDVLPKCENVYYLLDHAAQFIKDRITDSEEIRRYRVVFLYDNVYDYNSYLFIRQMILGPNNYENWAILTLRKALGSDILTPFSKILHFTTHSTFIPPNYTDVFSRANLGNQTVSEHVSLSLFNKIFLNYEIKEGLTNFTNNSLGSLVGNLDFSHSNNLTLHEHFLNSIILYLDYNAENNNNSNNDPNHNDLRIVGFGFITQDAGDNIEDRISAVEVLKGRESITNTDGILYEHTTITAFLRFIILYKYLGYDILCYATYNENTKEFKNIKTIDYVQKSRIYYDSSNNISEAKKKIEQKEEDGFIIFKRKIQGNDKIFISYNDDNQNSIELHFETIYQLESIISSLSNNRIRLVYADSNIKDIIQKYFNISTKDKIIFTLNRYLTYRQDPMYVTNNSGSLGNPMYIEFLSDYYPLYWYYDGNNRVPNTGTVSNVSVADRYFYNLHPCVLIYGNSVKYPDTKRHVKVRLVKHLVSGHIGNPDEYHYNSVTYIEIKDPVNLDNTIWSRLLSTQAEAKLPLDLDLITHTSNEVAPPVINLDYMTTPIQNFINANLISSRDILEYPMIPDTMRSSDDASEIDTALKVYYREVLYWKYLRYLINAGIVKYYFYNMKTWAAPDIVGYSVRRLNNDDGIPKIEITLSVPFYDNRVIDAIEIEINIVS